MLLLTLYTVNRYQSRNEEAEMKITIIGGKTGLGRHIALHFADATVLSRPVYNIATEEGRTAICNEVERSGSDVVILNSFDHSDHNAQYNMFDALWTKFNMSKITIVIISSFGRLYADRGVGDSGFKSYCAVKKKISEDALRRSFSDVITAKLVVIEPCVLENNMGRSHLDGTYLSYKEFIKMIDAGLREVEDCRAVCITKIGQRTVSSLLKEAGLL